MLKWNLKWTIKGSERERKFGKPISIAYGGVEVSGLRPGYLSPFKVKGPYV